jgi:hypothetical protein
MVGEKMQKKDLCIVCAPMEEQSDAHCEYCGAPAESGWATAMWSADGTKVEESHFVCEQCLKDGRKKKT